ncbi:MAG: pyridoxamine 5'-phosphate oxidase family protein [Pseudomonadota bacterium]
MSVGWKQRLARSLHINRSHADARYLQLATVDASGHPHNRTVVFRGFSDADPLTLLTVTDTRSEKVAHTIGDARVSVAWYFRKSREQYRLNGQAVLRTERDGGADVLTVWQSLSPTAREQFYWPTPKAPLSDAAPVHDDGAVSPHFAVLAIVPDYVEYLALRPTPQCREIYMRTHAGWSSEAVNP